MCSNLKYLVILLVTFPALLLYAAPPPERAPREIFVPYGDLHVLLEQQPQRVMLTREEFDALVQKAKKTPEKHVPQKTVLAAAEYEVAVHDQRAELTGRLTIDVLEEGLQAVPLNIAGVGLRRAELDGKPAALGRAEAGPLLLFVEGLGRHVLRLEMVAPVLTSAARQTLRYRLPRPAATQLALTVAGDVEVRSGAAVIRRTVEADGSRTHFALLPQEGDTTLVMSLNSRLRRQQTAVIARSVVILDEVTTAYEKIHATALLEILYRAIDQVRFAVPKGFEITDVRSPLLSRWEVQEQSGRKVLTIKLREQTTEPVALSLSGLRTSVRLDAWQAPRLKALDVVAQASIVGLLVEERLKPEALSAEGLIAIDTEELNKILPAEILRPAPGTPPLKAVAAYYAPQGQFSLTAKFIKPAVELSVNTGLLWRVGQEEQELLGGMTLLPLGEKLFTFDFCLPADWTVTGVTAAGEKPLSFERYPAGDGSRLPQARYHVRLSPAVPADQEFKVNFRATRTPPGWLADWKTQKQDFPVCEVRGATRTEGAVAVETRDDLVARPEKLQQLTPLGAGEKARYGLENVAVNLAYRCENPTYAATLIFERTPPRITARAYSFLKLEAEGLTAHYQLNYLIEEARTQTLSLLLPADTPSAVRIQGLEGVEIKETSFEPAADGSLRRWNVLLAEPRRGKVRLAVDFQQPLPETAVKDAAEGDSPIFADHASMVPEKSGPSPEQSGPSPQKSGPSPILLPLIAADRVEYQSGVVGIEGSEEFETQVKTDARKVDVGELSEADHPTGQRLLGAWGYAGQPPAVTVSLTRKPAYTLYPVIVEKASLLTQLSPQGESRTQVDFRLRAKALYVELQLPTQDAELWSARIDGEPIKPQREGKRLLLGLPATQNAAHDLQIVYRISTPTVRLAGTVALEAPKLLLRAERETQAVEVPLVDLEWKLALPSGYEVVRTGGTVTPTDLDRPVPAAFHVAGALYYLAGGIGQFGCLQQVAREAGRRRPARVAPSSGGTLKQAGVATKMESPPVACEPAPAEKPSGGMGMGGMAGMGGSGQRPARGMYLEDKVRRFPEEARAGGREVSPPETSLPNMSLIVKGEQSLVPKISNGKEANPFEEEKSQPQTTESLMMAVTPKVTLQEEGEEKLGAVPHKDLTGVRSLMIDLALPAGGRVMTFQSLGADPRLEVELASTERFGAMGWAVALAAGLIGLMLTYRSCRVKTWFILGCLVLATVIPILWDCTALARVCNMLFYAATLLIPYYLIAALVRKTSACCCRAARWCCSKPAATAGLILATLVLVGSASLQAEEPKANDPRIEVQVIQPEPPVKVPDDVIIVPYDLDDIEGLRSAPKLLVPYAKYVELWNRAYPDQKLETPKPPADYALAGAAYQTTLEGDDYLLVTGHVEIDVFTREYVQVPLGLSGGVLARADLDGQPAQLQLVNTDREGKGDSPIIADHASMVPEKSGQSPVPPAPVMLLTLSGKGRHKLELAVRMKLAHEGGWRLAGGNLPTAPAAALTIAIPQAGTEVRLQNLPDRAGYDTQQPGETVVTALGAAGRIGLRWRPKVSEGQVDRGLTARSDAVLDVQEDGLRLTWRLTLDFRGTPQEEFSVTVPPDYLVEKVEGGNVRGWESVKKDAGRVIRVTLLKAAKEQEQIILRLRHPVALGLSTSPSGEGMKVSVPLLTLPQAALHTGQITLRRSPLLDVRTTDHPGLTRCDVPADLKPLIGAADTDSPLHVRPFEAYQFDRDPTAIGLSVAPLTPRLSAAVQTVFAVSEYARKLEIRIQYHVQDRPVFRLQVALPKGFRLDHLSAPGDYEYALTDSENRRLLTIFLAAGRSADFAVVLSGTLRSENDLQRIAVPRVEVLGAERQEGDVAVLVDADYEFENAKLENCEQVLLDRLRGWLKPEQFALTRAGLHYRQGGYAATLKFRPRTPEVSCDTISNVRVTDRAIEETIILDYTIRRAGIRRVSFLLPSTMERAKISAPLLRQKTLRRVGDQPDSPLRVVLELQDKVLDQLRILVENDRQFTDKPQSAPIPKVEDAEVNRQYVTLESAGRDELVVGQLAGLTKLQPEQAEWKSLRKILPRQMTHAYLVAESAVAPRLTYQSKVRRAAEVVNAWIGLVETVLVLDDNGAYRAEQTYYLRNATEPEQYLKIELPSGATLWTAWVAGEAVKPVRSAKEPRHALIPLIKSAEGDRPYPIVLRYGGKLEALKNLRPVDFPLARSVNVHPDLSQVRLYLPKDRRWFNFGGKMRQVAEEAELLAGKVQFQTKVTENLRQNVLHGDMYAQQRAGINLSFQAGEIAQLREKVQDQMGNLNLQQAFDVNDAAMELAQKDMAQYQNAPPESATVADNDAILRKYYETQRNRYSGTALQKMGANFGMISTPANQEGKKGVRFNTDWLATNALSGGMSESRTAGKESAQSGRRHAGYSIAKKSAGPLNYRPSAAQVAQGEDKENLARLAEETARQKMMEEEDQKGITRFRSLVTQQAVQRGEIQQSPPSGAGASERRIYVGGAVTLGGDRVAGPGFAPQPPAAAPTTAPNAVPPPPAQPALEAAALPATGLLSLDFTLPTREGRWQVYWFTTPRGETQITAQSLSNNLARRTIQLIAALAAIGVAIALIRSAQASRWQWLARPLPTWGMIILGVILILTGAFPVAGILLLLVGLGLKIRRPAPAAASATPSV